MKLLVDVGNTAVKWACLEGDDLQPGQAFRHADGAFPQLASRAWDGLAVPEAVHVACVAGAVREQALADWCRMRWQCEPGFVRTTPQACGVSCGYQEPATLGVDRWVALIGRIIMSIRLLR